MSTDTTVFRYQDQIVSLRARIAELEAERDAMHTRLAPSLEYCGAGPCGYGDDEIDRLSTKLQDLKLATLAALTQAGICMLEENPITPSEVKSAIARLARNRDTWLKTATELASLRGVLIEFWEATAKGEHGRIEAARTSLMSAAGYLVARKEKGELV